MSMNHNTIASCSAELRDILLIYLQFMDGQWFPGSDGQTLDDALAFYPHAIAAGVVPDKEELARLHPHLQGDLKHFFSSENFFCPVIRDVRR